jgi:hypothetical protein
MLAIIRCADDRRVSALVLSFGQFTMRILPQGARDTAELTFHYGQWTDEGGLPVEFEAFVAAGSGPENEFVLRRSAACQPAVPLIGATVGSN